MAKSTDYTLSKAARLSDAVFRVSLLHMAVILNKMIL